MSVPTVEDRVEDIRRRAALLRYLFELQQYQNDDVSSVDHADNDVCMALQDYVDGIITATRAIDAAQEGTANPKAPDVEEDE